MEREFETMSRLIDSVVEFAVGYGFQIAGALVVLVVGLRLAGWLGRKTAKISEARNIDAMLARFLGNIVKLVVVGFVILVTLGNFGVTIAPLIALAGASAFGATMALQGPLSNYGAGLAIILGRPFVVGNTITVGITSGVVEEVTLAATKLVGEDGERITVPNKEIVGEVIINSRQSRVVQTKICVGYEADTEAAVSALREALSGFPGLAEGPPSQIGIHDFTYGGIVLGLRFWVPTKKYFQTRYAVNQAALGALNEAGIQLMPGGIAAVAAGSLSADTDRSGA